MTDTVLNLAEDNISQGNVNIHKFNHPSITERSEETARRKLISQGSAVKANAARECSVFFGRAVCLCVNYAGGNNGGQKL